MNELINRKFTIRVNKLHWEFYSQSLCQLRYLSILLSVCLYVFPQGFKTDLVKVILQLCWLIC